MLTSVPMKGRAQESLARSLLTLGSSTSNPSGMRLAAPGGIIRLSGKLRKERAVSTSSLFRWGGLAAMVGGVLYILGELMDIYNFGLSGEEEFSAVAATASYAIETWIFLLGTLLVLFGLFGLYDRQSEAAGPLGLAGFLVAFLGTALAVGASWGDALIVVPVLADAAPELLDAGPPSGYALSFGIFALGWLLFGVAALRARVYPRWAALLLIGGAVLSFLPLPLSTAPFGLAVAWMGFALLTGRGAADERPPRVS